MKIQAIHLALQGCASLGSALSRPLPASLLLARHIRSARLDFFVALKHDWRAMWRSAWTFGGTPASTFRSCCLLLRGRGGILRLPCCCRCALRLRGGVSCLNASQAIGGHSIGRRRLGRGRRSSVAFGGRNRGSAVQSVHACRVGKAQTGRACLRWRSSKRRGIVLLGGFRPLRAYGVSWTYLEEGAFLVLSCALIRLVRVLILALVRRLGPARGVWWNRSIGSMNVLGRGSAALRQCANRASRIGR